MTPARRLSFETHLAELRERMAQAKPRARVRRQRAAWRRRSDLAKLSRLLERSERAARLEKYVSAMAGCRTSFARVLEYSKYVLEDGERIVSNPVPSPVVFNRPNL